MGSFSNKKKRKKIQSLPWDCRTLWGERKKEVAENYKERHRPCAATHIVPDAVLGEKRNISPRGVGGIDTREQKKD